jgi:hypothetical protein
MQCRLLLATLWLVVPPPVDLLLLRLHAGAKIRFCAPQRLEFRLKGTDLIRSRVRIAEFAERATKRTLARLHSRERALQVIERATVVGERREPSVDLGRLCAQRSEATVRARHISATIRDRGVSIGLRGRLTLNGTAKPLIRLLKREPRSVQRLFLLAAVFALSGNRIQSFDELGHGGFYFAFSSISVAWTATITGVWKRM